MKAAKFIFRIERWGKRTKKNEKKKEVITSKTIIKVKTVLTKHDKEHNVA